MRILFCVQLLIEMDNPWLYTNFLTSYFKEYILELQGASQDIDIAILMGEAPFFVYEKMEGVKPARKCWIMGSWIPVRY